MQFSPPMMLLSLLASKSPGREMLGRPLLLTAQKPIHCVHSTLNTVLRGETNLPLRAHEDNIRATSDILEPPPLQGGHCPPPKLARSAEATAKLYSSDPSSLLSSSKEPTRTLLRRKSTPSLSPIATHQNNPSRPWENALLYYVVLYSPLNFPFSDKTQGCAFYDQFFFKKIKMCF